MLITIHYDKNNKMDNLKNLVNSDLGVNVYHLHDCVKEFENGVFVDLGVRTGVSSHVMLTDAQNKNNKVYGVDVNSSLVNPSVMHHPNYKFLLSDSVTQGKQWGGENVDILFVDTFHTKEQVMSELYYWYQYISKNGYIVFHDSNWPKDKHDVYGGITFPRVDEGIRDFFGVDKMNYEDDNIKMSTYPESWGMTIVKIKNKKDYISLYSNWGHIFERRNHLISLFWNKDNSSNVNIELDINI